MKDFAIVVDTREQKPFTFHKISPKPKVIHKGLKTGDYSLNGYEQRICIERKSLPDLYSSFGKERARFEKECYRMSLFDYAAIVCEADWNTILRCPPSRSKLHPKSLFSSIVAWSQRYNIHFIPSPNRIFAERITYRMLERFYNDLQVGLYQHV